MITEIPDVLFAMVKINGDNWVFDIFKDKCVDTHDGTIRFKNEIYANSLNHYKRFPIDVSLEEIFDMDGNSVVQVNGEHRSIGEGDCIDLSLLLEIEYRS